jgi:hypothetical protein
LEIHEGDLELNFGQFILELCNSKLILKDEFSGYIIPTGKSKNLSWNHLLLKIKLLFSRKSYVCPKWIFIIDTEQGQINSAWVQMK